MILTALLFAILCANPQNAILHVPNLKTQFAMLNAKNPSAKLNAPIKDVKCLIAQNVLLFASNLIALLIARLLNRNVKLSVKNPNVTGNATNLNALNLNVS
jgi:hypothetical protein